MILFLHKIVLTIQVIATFTKALLQLIYGTWKVGALPNPIVTIFGSARNLKNPIYGHKAFELANHCSSLGISVLTGGGPGIMKAANCGAAHNSFTIHKGKTLGIGVTNLQEKPNNCVHEYIQLDYFFARKWLLIAHSRAFVVFPGGFGTFDELAELLTLIQTHKIPRTPIFLVGSDYWNAMMIWMYEIVLAEGAVNHEDLALITVTDDIDLILKGLEQACKGVIS